MRSRMHPEIARALAPFAPPDSVVHQTAEEAADSNGDRWREEALLAADRTANINKAGRAAQRKAEWALEQQQRHLTAIGQLGGL